MCVCVCVCVYIYIYIERERERDVTKILLQIRSELSDLSTFISCFKI